MFTKLKIVVVLVLFCANISAQNNALILNDAAYVVLSGGTSTKPIYVVVNQSNALGIERKVANKGWIISEGEYNYTQWNIGTSGPATYVIPYNYSSTDMPFTMDITSAGVGGNAVLFSTYHTAASDNLPIPTYDGSTTIPQINNGAGSNNSAKMLDRWWVVDATSGYTTKPAATLTFSYLDVEHSVASNSITEANLQAQSFNTSTSNWVAADVYGTDVPASNYVNAAAIPATKLFRAWVLVDNTSLLPIELISFTSTCNNDEVDIAWSTASETQNDYFTLEKSNDSKIWEPLAIIDGAGNSNTMLNYSFVDRENTGKTIFYRLKQTDYNGNFKYSEIISSNCTSKIVVEPITINNNPADENIIITLNATPGTAFSYVLCDNLGRTQLSSHIILINNTEKISISKSTLARGLYYFLITSANEVQTSKIVVIK